MLSSVNKYFLTYSSYLHIRIDIFGGRSLQLLNLFIFLQKSPCLCVSVGRYSWIFISVGLLWQGLALAGKAGYMGDQLLFLSHSLRALQLTLILYWSEGRVEK